ncbi:class I SAM-dependent methyltransferase [Chloroflexota bacterium]
MNPPLATYDSIGSGYNSRRSADSRILARLESLIGQPDSARILDVGAGTGNYTKALAERGYQLWAIEPSKLMIDSAADKEMISWYLGAAEALPFRDNFFDATYCTLSLHHFSDQAKGIGEIYRVLKSGGRFVAFTSDPRRVPADFWMRTYFGELFEQAGDSFPSIAVLIKRLVACGFKEVVSEPYLIPADNEDGFFCSAWQRPNDYLDQDYRNGISSFRLMAPKRLETAILSLKADLLSGRWEMQHGSIRNKRQYDGGYTFVAANK